MTLHQFLAAYLEPVQRVTGLRGVESFWVYSALLSVEVFCVVAFMAWAFLRISRHVEYIKARTVRMAITWGFLAVYCVVLMTSMLLFLAHEQIRQHSNPATASEYAYFGAALAFFLVGWSPVFYLFWRKQRLNPNGA
jgi:hypothetical protein